jgi:hypothetical protein
LMGLSYTCNARKQGRETWKEKDKKKWRREIDLCSLLNQIKAEVIYR